MKKPRLTAIEWSSPPSTVEAVAKAKRVLRSADLQAVALITVTRDGVGTLYGGASEGFYHNLVSATEHLKARIMRDAE